MAREPSPSSPPQLAELHTLAQEHDRLARRVTELERKVRFLMARLTSDELERYERVED